MVALCSPVPPRTVTVTSQCLQLKTTLPFQVYRCIFLRRNSVRTSGAKVVYSPACSSNGGPGFQFIVIIVDLRKNPPVSAVKTHYRSRSGCCVGFPRTTAYEDVSTPLSDVSLFTLAPRSSQSRVRLTTILTTTDARAHLTPARTISCVESGSSINNSLLTWVTTRTYHRELRVN